jgi:hypothetical protein
MKLRYPQKDNGMYIISRYDFDAIARQFLSEYAPGVLAGAKPVSIGDIAEEHLGLTLKYQNLSPDGEVSGLISFGDTEYDCYDNMFRPIKLEIADGTILIDYSLSKQITYPRRRFTIAHEVSHRLLHRSYRSQTNRHFSFRRKQDTLIACRAVNIEQANTKSDGKWTDHQWEEWQADSLAASILMPIDTIKPFATEIIYARSGKTYLNSATDRIIRQEIIKKIANVFYVSHRAVEIRMKQLLLMQ